MTTMLTIAELQGRTDAELRMLFRLVSDALARTDRGTPERRNALATLENIASVLNDRQTRVLSMAVGL